MTKTKIGKFQASPLSRFGDAGPHVQHGDTITMGELIDLIRREKIAPEQIFEKEDFLKDKKLMKAIDEKIELEKYRAEDQELNKQMDEEIEADKLAENSMIPGSPDKLTPEQKKRQEEDNEFIPDNEPEGEDNDLIPD